MSVTFISPYIARPVRSLPDAEAEIAAERAEQILDARWQYNLHRRDMLNAAFAAEESAGRSRGYWTGRLHWHLNYMGYWRRQLLRLKVGDQRYHEMGLAFRAQQRKPAILWDEERQHRHRERLGVGRTVL